jgi:cyclopropane fatty-acyl-phospholipid synthase-like methyltransferase
MYTDFAYYYDRLMYDVDYNELSDYVESLLKQYMDHPKTVLDLGCGTGSFTVEFAKRGYEMIGLDLSCDMLSCAKEKARENKLDILFLNQDMTRMELYGTVDAIVSTTDCINYISNRKSLQRLFKLAKNYLNPGGVFIFDINSAYKLQYLLGDNVFYDVGENVSYIWQSRYYSKKKTVEFDMTFFVKEDDLYRRFDECHIEKIYTIDELKSISMEHDFKVVDVFDGMTCNKPTKRSERIFFVIKRVSM